jgi:hypothetical protein
MAFSAYSKWRSLRFWLPAFLTLLAIGAGLGLYVFEVGLNETRFEAEFNRVQTLQAARIQADVERWVERNDPAMVESIFAELTVSRELKSAVFLDTTNTVLAATRREDLGRPFNPEHLGLDQINPSELYAALQTARHSMQGRSWFTSDRNGLILCFPSSLPLRLGELGVHSGGLILVSYDLRL